MWIEIWARKEKHKINQQYQCVVSEDARLAGRCGSAARRVEGEKRRRRRGVVSRKNRVLDPLAWPSVHACSPKFWPNSYFYFLGQAKNSTYWSFFPNDFNDRVFSRSLIFLSFLGRGCAVVFIGLPPI
jgi:hypothetical protein